VDFTAPSSWRGPVVSISCVPLTVDKAGQLAAEIRAIASPIRTFLTERLFIESFSMAKNVVPLFSAPSFTQGGWASELRKAVLSRQRFIFDWSPKYRIWRGTGVR